MWYSRMTMAIVLDNMVRENGDASVVITPAEGWRIRDIIIDEPENAENSEESENIMSVQPVACRGWN